MNNNPIVTMKIENKGEIKIELYPHIAPNTVNNFISLIKKGFYDGLMFHRVIQGFMIQCGCPKGNGTGNAGYSIKGEFSKNGFVNNLSHTEGIISMARSAHPDSAGSQFFLMTSVSPHLDGSYAGFGRVVEGMDILEALEKVKTNFSDKPLDDIVLESATVDTFGVEYPEPIIV
jgi:peptidyl-prolyl cis-trans isomerase B (cyclophilin B)